MTIVVHIISLIFSHFQYLIRFNSNHFVLFAGNFGGIKGNILFPFQDYWTKNSLVPENLVPFNWTELKNLRCQEPIYLFGCQEPIYFLVAMNHFISWLPGTNLFLGCREPFYFLVIPTKSFFSCPNQNFFWLVSTQKNWCHAKQPKKIWFCPTNFFLVAATQINLLW